MKRNEPVSTIMTPNPVTVTLANKPSEARAIFAEHRFHHLPVLSGEDLMGVISVFDLMKVTWGDPTRQDPRALDTFLDHTTTLETFLTRNVVTVSPKDTIRRAAELLSEGTFHALPVCEGRKLVGIITTTDLIRYLVDQY